MSSVVPSGLEVSSLVVPSADETQAGAGAGVVDVGHVVGDNVVLAICVAVDAAIDVKGCLDAVLFPGSKMESHTKKNPQMIIKTQ